MVVFDLFEDAVRNVTCYECSKTYKAVQSFVVRAGYISQLRELDLVWSYFIPQIFGLLGLEQGASKAFKLDAWSVDEFSVQCKSALSVQFQ
jgi:hypothetical protein